MTNFHTDNGTAVSVQDAFEQKNDIFEQYFIPLGYAGSNYYFFIKHSNKIVRLKNGQFKYRFLSKLAPLSLWKDNFPSTDYRFLHQVDWPEVRINMIGKCIAKGKWEGVIAISNENLEAFA